MILLVFPLKLQTFQKEVTAFASLMCLFGPAHILFSYLLSFAYTKPQNALKFISVIYMISGFVIPFILKLLSVGIDRCDGYTYTLTQMLSQAVPLQPMSSGLINMMNRQHSGLIQE